jgi:hypothetical protein
LIAISSNTAVAQRLLARVISFPAGKHDDQVDALGLIGQLLDRMVPQRVTKPEEPARRNAYVEYTERVDIDLTTF